MHRGLSKLIPAALVAAISLGVPALAKSIRAGKAHPVASDSTLYPKAKQERALDGYGSVRRAPSFGAPNPNSPTHAGGATYNPALYVY